MGEVRPIVTVGDPVLHHPCEPVTRFDGDLAALVDDMFASMYAAEGVGLAANQIGVPLRVFVYDCPDDEGVRHRGVVVNPELEVPGLGERHLDPGDEGCLSVPGQYAPLPRPDRATVRGLDAAGEPVTVEGTGLLARCLQHETDHLDGYLYIDRLPAKRRKQVLAAYQESTKEQEPTGGQESAKADKAPL
ncbi:peptide deformylase [Nonomuraea thailandensis]|uniref:Peptide deformylase n=1 Tax=Nonomuraea thailandensis TaxID=1188745 RepID=A0A9X2GPY9_9ACTN|nr:peptide deformylase [Nonomuraea thailandensis]MCP2358683.1 peptide deformylase [Nonomuraea thailandensis]